MSNAALSVVFADEVDADEGDGFAEERECLAPAASGPARLHRIQEVRRREGMSLRTAARQLKTDIRDIRRQENATSDLKLTDLYKWERVLEVPAAELLEESDEPLSRVVRERAAMVRVMKSARSLLENASDDCRPLAENLVDQIVQVMPELAEVGAWPSVGQRRTFDELGVAADRTMPELSVFAPDSDG
jgi:transcriptional regulator with XRE-family HTH domain